mmetsp:Transcript_11919/g.32221  ORF Transcript_11919/g.32221 Transcript_11919/m.32221 type:complete len:202 (+) Transcript_11919:195-800(+)
MAHIGMFKRARRCLMVPDDVFTGRNHFSKQTVAACSVEDGMSMEATTYSVMSRPSSSYGWHDVPSRPAARNEATEAVANKYKGRELHCLCPALKGLHQQVLGLLSTHGSGVERWPVTASHTNNIHNVDGTLGGEEWKQLEEGGCSHHIAVNENKWHFFAAILADDDRPYKIFRLRRLEEVATPRVQLHWHIQRPVGCAGHS